MKRAIRIQKTNRVVLARTRLRHILCGYTSPTPGRWKKCTPFGCGCGKRKYGQPKIWKGICDIGGRDRIFKWRKLNRNLAQLCRQKYVSVDWETFDFQEQHGKDNSCFLHTSSVC